MFYGLTRQLLKEQLGNHPLIVSWSGILDSSRIGVKSLRNEAFDENVNNQLIEETLVLLDEISAKAAQRDLQYKRAIVRYHNARVKQSGIKEGDLVLLRNDVSQEDPNWNLDIGWEGLSCIVKSNGNESYKLQYCEMKILGEHGMM